MAGKATQKFSMTCTFGSDMILSGCHPLLAKSELNKYLGLQNLWTFEHLYDVKCPSYALIFKQFYDINSMACFMHGKVFRITPPLMSIQASYQFIEHMKIIILSITWEKFERKGYEH
ncbi:hypothetical protein Droror1_Dr00023233 [Drosera rotundifolia]